MGTVKFALTERGKELNVPFPTRAHQNDAGFDLRAVRWEWDEAVMACAVYTGVCADIPPGYCGIIKERSSWARKGLQVVGGVIDSGYRGEIVVLCRGFLNLWAEQEQTAFPRFAQLIITTVWQGDPEYVDALAADSERGGRGFGSTGNS